MERIDLGNDLPIMPAMAHELLNHQATDLVWLAETYHTAKLFDDGMDVEIYNLPKEAIEIAIDGDGGHLYLLNPGKVTWLETRQIK